MELEKRWTIFLEARICKLNNCGKCSGLESLQKEGKVEQCSVIVCNSSKNKPFSGFFLQVVRMIHKFQIYVVSVIWVQYFTTYWPGFFGTVKMVDIYDAYKLIHQALQFTVATAQPSANEVQWVYLGHANWF